MKTMQTKQMRYFYCESTINAYNTTRILKIWLGKFKIAQYETNIETEGGNLEDVVTVKNFGR